MEQGEASERVIGVELETMRWELFVSFFSAALIVQLIPGPGMLFILANGIAGGPRAGIAAACGAASGMVFHTFAAALGLAALFSQAPAAYDALRIAGGIYLLWLAIGHFRTASSALAAEPGERRPARRVFVRAWLNNLANPKVILFYLAFLPQFVAPGGGVAHASADRARVRVPTPRPGHRSCARGLLGPCRRLAASQAFLPQGNRQAGGHDHGRARHPPVGLY